MNVVRQAIAGVVVLEPKAFGDEHGFFFEGSSHAQFEEAIGRPISFVQDNHSQSTRNVLHGLHCQIRQRQGKLVRVVTGGVFDVAADIRKVSPIFRYWAGSTLSAKNEKQSWLPEGFAHGFVMLSGSADFLFSTTDYHAPQRRHCIAWNDPDLAIAWPVVGEPVLSGKDTKGAPFHQAEVF